MQQLSAEAEKTLPGMPIVADDCFAPAHEPAEPAETNSVTERVGVLENTLLSRFEQLATRFETARAATFAEQFRKIDDQLASVRNTESVNQKLFDSLHAELLKYRDNFVHESLQKPFIHDLVLLYDDLSGLCEQIRAAVQEKGTRGHVAQWCENLQNAIHALVEILHRFDVREVDMKERVDLAVHRVINYEPAEFPEDDGRILMRLKRGFVWRGKLIRPEEVIAKRYG